MEAVEFHSHLALEWERKYDKSRSFVSRERVFNRILKPIVNTADIWLDAGCGTGHFTRVLRKFGAKKVVGIDASEEMISAAKGLTPANDQREHIDFKHCGCISRLDYGDCFFDGIFCSSVIEYNNSPELVLCEFWRVLKPGGHLIMSLPNRLALIRRFEALSFFLSKRLFGRPCPHYLLFVKNQYDVQQAVNLIAESNFTLNHLELGGSGIGPACLDHRRYWGPLIFIAATKKNPS